MPSNARFRIASSGGAVIRLTSGTTAKGTIMAIEAEIGAWPGRTEEQGDGQAQARQHPGPDPGLGGALPVQPVE